MYTVYYKTGNSLFWKKIQNVKGDTFVPENGNRVLITKDEERFEIPSSYLIRFSKERFWDIKRKMEQEAGQPIPVITEEE